ncbi:hypothetical protein FRB90_007459 [Tulasnella sp. 427]|nr:hypothetical protein FRB90_007459 [Tulasnella sp. 427]
MLGTERNVMETFNILLPESQRWRELWLVFGLPEISQTLKVISLPMLETLEMVLNYGVGDPASLERPNLQTCPSLRFFSIISVPLDWSSSLPVPGGLRHLAIEMVKHGPTPSQMLALLSSTVQLEALLMNYVGPPPGHDWGSAEEQKPVIMPYLRKIRLIRMDPIFVKQLISHIHAESCSVIALQCIAPSSYRDIKLLQSKLARIAASLERIFVIIDDHESQGIVHISSFDTTDQTRLFAASQSTETPGFSLTFLTGPHSIRIEAAMDFLAYTQIPISMTLQCSLRANRWALRNIDWDRLPSLCELTIAPHVGIFSIMYPLCAPRGPRKALRWVCPKLTVLRFHKLGFLHPAFPWYLRLRWGPPESNDDDDDENDGMKRDPSRPTQLTLCEVPLQNISKFLSPEEMKHFAAEWKDSTPIAAVDSRSPGQMEGQKLLPAGEDAVAEVSNP